MPTTKKKTFLSDQTLVVPELPLAEPPRDEIMNFRVSKDFRKKFRQTALDLNLNLSQTLEAALTALEQQIYRDPNSPDAKVIAPTRLNR